MLLRILIITVLALMVYFGIRRIWKDWSQKFDRDAAEGFRLDIPAGTSRRFEPGASREVAIVAFKGARRVPGIQVKGEK